MSEPPQDSEADPAAPWSLVHKPSNDTGAVRYGPIYLANGGAAPLFAVGDPAHPERIVISARYDVFAERCGAQESLGTDEDFTCELPAGHDGGHGEQRERADGWTQIAVWTDADAAMYEANRMLRWKP